MEKQNKIRVKVIFIDNLDNIHRRTIKISPSEIEGLKQENGFLSMEVLE